MKLSDLRSDKIKAQDAEVFGFIDDLFKSTQKQYLKQHRDWYINERFTRGDHWIVFNKTLNKIQTIPIQDGEIRRTINKIRTQIRGVKNFIKRNQPRWEVHPEDLTDEGLKEAKQKNKILQNIYKTLKFPMLLTDVIVSGLKYSVGILEGGMVKEEGENKIKFWFNDTFDILFDPFARDIQSCRYLFKAIKKPLNAVTENKDYTIKGELKPAKDEGVSNYKTLLEQEKYGRDTSSGSNELDELIVKECWIKWEDADGIHVKVFTLAGNQLIRVFSPKYRRYPIFGYNPERDPGAIYSDSWIKDLISLNKSLDRGASQIEGYIQRMLAGKYLIKQGVEVSSITDKGAEKIYYKGSVAPTQLNLQPLPAAPFSHLDNCERWIEEAGGTREASLGRVPGSIQSGKGIEALQAADAGTVAEPIENLQYFLSEIGEFCLELISDYTIASQTIIEEEEEVRYTGEAGENIEGVIKVRPTKVDVRIVPEIAYSEDARFERLMQLAQAQLIDPETVLTKLSISNVSDIIERVQKEKDEKYKQEMMKQRESHRTEGVGPEDTADLAHQENIQMAAKRQVPVTPKALWTPEHTELHMAFIRENRDAYQQAQQLFDEHIQNEEAYQQQQ
jgi:hypothetical protein